jgi:hypothetical protein
MAAAPPSTLDAAVAGGAESKVVAHWATIAGCGDAIGASAAAESAGAHRREEIGDGGDAESVGVAR